jgi:PAS domain-containing protein
VSDPTTETDVGPDLAAVVERLREQNEQLHDAMRHRAVIEQAKGYVAATAGVSVDEAFELLRTASRRHNVKLARLAAAVVAGTRGPAPAGADPGGDDELDAEALAAADSLRRAGAEAPTQVRPARRPPRGELAGGDLELALAGVRSATSPVELLESVVADCRWPPACDQAVLMLVEPDGSLAVVTGVGISSLVLSQWRRIPVSSSVPAMDCARSRRPVVSLSAAQTETRYEDLRSYGVTVPTLVNLPLSAGGRLWGVLHVGWRRALQVGDTDLQALGQVAGAVADWLVDHVAELPSLAERFGLGVLEGDVTGDRSSALLTTLDAVLDPVLVVRPVGDAGVDDYQVDWGNDAACTWLGLPLEQLVSASLLELFPALAAARSWGVLRRVLDGGHSETVTGGSTLDSRRGQWVEGRVVRLYDGLLLTWRPTSRTP